MKRINIKSIKENTLIQNEMNEDSHFNPACHGKTKSKDKSIVDFSVLSLILNEISLLRNEVSTLKNILNQKQREENSLTTEQVAEQVQKSPKTIRRWVNAGILRAKKAGNTFLITQSDLDIFLLRFSDLD